MTTTATTLHPAGLRRDDRGRVLRHLRAGRRARRRGARHGLRPRPASAPSGGGQLGQPSGGAASGPPAAAPAAVVPAAAAARRAEQPAVAGAPGRRAGRDPAGARPGPGHRGAGQPGGRREQAVLRRVRPAGRAQPGRAAGPGRGVLPELRQQVLVLPEAAARRAGRRAVRGARLPGPRRARLDLPGHGPQPRPALGGAQGPAQHRRRRRLRRRPWPSGGSWPRSSTRTSSTSTTSCSTPTARTGESAGYIVMEYVGGKSLKQILLERRQSGQSLPLPDGARLRDRGAAALGYLHSQGLVYCDFKPDNVIQTQEQLKLIDMGGVRRIDDDDSAIYGTVGYQAPEIAAEGPSPSSDLYTVGRALAVLTVRVHRLPGQVRAQPARPGDGAAAGPAGVVLPGAAARHRSRSRPPVRLGGRDGRAADRGAARGARGRRRQAPAGVLRPVQPRTERDRGRGHDRGQRRRPRPPGLRPSELRPPAPAAHPRRRWPRSWPGSRCLRWTPPTRRPATWPR